jgi:hypothetical protein
MKIQSTRVFLQRTLGLTAGAALLLVAFGCAPVAGPGTGPGTNPGPGSTSLPIAADIVILDDPVGGAGASEIACTFEATQIGVEGNRPIQIRVDWSASCGTHKSEAFTFRGPDQVFTSTYEDPTGTPISMTFWATITWVDSRGKHVVRSASAAP